MLEIFFPDKCSACKNISNNKICNNCLLKIDFLADLDICNSCGEPFNHIYNDSGNKNYCMRCLKNEFYFDRARSLALHSGIIKELLHQFKYRDKIILARTLCDILTDRFPLDFYPFDVVFPVPLHIKKLRKREYNQALLIAKCIASKMSADFDPFNLYKNAENRPQFEMGSLRERVENVRGYFSLKKKQKVRGSSVLLVDDVFTTGSTVNECSRVIQMAGASKIQVLTLTRAAH